MSDVRRIIEMYIDVSQNEIKGVDSTGNVLVDLPEDQTAYRATQIVYRCHLKIDSDTYYQPDTDAVWLFGIDNVFTADHADLVVSTNDQFNIGEDWSSLDPTGGKITWRADLTTAELKAALGDDAQTTMYACLWMCPPGGSYTLMAQWNVRVRNIAVDPTTATSTEGVAFVTVDALEPYALQNDVDQITTPTGGVYRIKNGAIQWMNPDQGNKFHTVGIRGAAGSEYILIGSAED